MRPPTCLPLRPALALLLGFLFVSPAHAGTYAWRTTDSGGNTTALSPTFSGGQWYYGYGDPTVPVPYGWGDYGSGGSTGTGNSSGQVNSTGTVTVIFTWQPGYAGEPAPPALITQTCDSYWYCNAPAPPAASCSNGLSDPEVDSPSGQSYRGESRGTHYSVVFPEANGTVTVTLTGAQAHVPLSSSGSYSSNVWYSIDAYPIVLSSPDPLGRPDLGDGKNQFVYDTGVPGRVNVPAIITCLGAGTPDTSWVVAGNHVDVAFLPAIAGQEPHTWSAFGADIGHGPGYFTFDGLPTEYNGSLSDSNRFGNHLAILKVDGSNSQSALFQTFFDMKASNWPGSNGYTPNWFWYYQQAYTPPQPDTVGANYNPNLGARGVTTVSPTISGSTNPSTYEYDIEIGPNACDDDIVNVFGIDPTTNLVKRIGGLSIKGLYCFARVISHEEEHVHLVKQQIVIPYNTQYGPPYGVTDTDGDGIPDDWEKAHHLDPNNSDTTGEYGNATGNNVGKGDVECLCDIFAMGELSSHQSLWQQDWGVINNGGSYSGLQYGKRPLYFPWQYIDDATYSISTSLPNNALTALP